MRLRPWALGLVAAVGWSTLALPAQPLNAVVTGGSGVLIKCFAGLVGSSCNTYHHVKLPEYIALGNTIHITFGSNTKNYGFPVLRIKLYGKGCRIYGNGYSEGQFDKLIITPCQAAPPTQ